MNNRTQPIALCLGPLSRHLLPYKPEQLAPSFPSPLQEAEVSSSPLDLLMITVAKKSFKLILDTLGFFLHGIKTLLLRSLHLS